MWKRMKRGDWLVATGIVLVGLLAMAAMSVGGNGDSLVVEVRVGDESVLIVDLDTDAEYEISLAATTAVVQVSGGRVRVLETGICPLHICAHTGWISRPGQAAVCLPNRMVVTVRNP